MRRALLAIALAGCTTTAPTRAPVVEDDLRLVALEDVGPGVGDAAPRLRVAFRRDGQTTPVDRDATALVARWRDGAALIDPQRRLYQVWPDGRRRMLAPNALALGTDGQRLAYAVERLHAVELRVHDGESERTWATGLASAARLTFVGDRVRFIGAANGGVAGVWEADASGATCRTNCELRTGGDWAGRYVAPPSDLFAWEAP